MSLLARLFGKKDHQKPRVRICVECGMPVAEHKDWCTIRLGQIELDRKSAKTSPDPA